MVAQGSPHSLLRRKHLLEIPPPPHTMPRLLHLHPHILPLLPHTVPLLLLPHILPLSPLTVPLPPHIQLPPTTSQLTTAASRRRRWRHRSVEKLENWQLNWWQSEWKKPISAQSNVCWRVRKKPFRTSFRYDVVTSESNNDWSSKLQDMIIKLFYNEHSGLRACPC